MAISNHVSFLLVVVSGFLATAEGSQKYDGYHLLRTVPRNNFQYEKLAALQNHPKVDFWSEPTNSGRPVDIFVHPDNVEPIIKYLNDSGLETEVLFDNAEKLIARSLTPRAAFGFTPRLDWKDYHTLDTINDWLNEQAKKYSEIGCVVTAGKSFEGRELVGLRIAYQPDLPVVFVEAGIHAREWIAPATATWIIQQVLNTTSDLIKSFEWHIFPVVNPDGYVFTHTEERCWRKNRNTNAHSRPYDSCMGVDLNRNFPYKWRSAKVSKSGNFDMPAEDLEIGATCRDNYSGPTPASEPEVQGLIKYVSAIASRTTVYFGLHSYGQLLMYPFTYSKTDVPANAETLARVGARAVDEVAHTFGTWYSSGHTAKILYDAPGTSLDFAYSIDIPYAFTLELRDKGEFGFLLPKELIIPTAKEAYHMLTVVLQDARTASLTSQTPAFTFPPSNNVISTDVVLPINEVSKHRPVSVKDLDVPEEREPSLTTDSYKLLDDDPKETPLPKGDVDKTSNELSVDSPISTVELYKFVKEGSNSSPGLLELLFKLLHDCSNSRSGFTDDAGKPVNNDSIDIFSLIVTIKLLNDFSNSRPGTTDDADKPVNNDSIDIPSLIDTIKLLNDGCSNLSPDLLKLLFKLLNENSDKTPISLKDIGNFRKAVSNPPDYDHRQLEEFPNYHKVSSKGDEHKPITTDDEYKPPTDDDPKYKPPVLTGYDEYRPSDEAKYRPIPYDHIYRPGSYTPNEDAAETQSEEYAKKDPWAIYLRHLVRYASNYFLKS